MTTTKTKRKPITFNVGDDTYNRVKAIFPELTGREENLVTLLDAFEAPPAEPKPDAESEKYREIIANLCIKFDCTADELEAHLTEKEEEFNATNDNLVSLDAENEQLKNKLSDLEKQVELHTITIEENAIIDWAKIKTTLQPFVVALLETTAKKLSAKYGREIKPMQILVDMFVRYTVEHWTQWFYPFVLSDREIVSIANAINPEITRMEQIKKTLPK